MKWGLDVVERWHAGAAQRGAASRAPALLQKRRGGRIKLAMRVTLQMGTHPGREWCASLRYRYTNGCELLARIPRGSPPNRSLQVQRAFATRQESSLLTNNHSGAAAARDRNGYSFWEI